MTPFIVVLGSLEDGSCYPEWDIEHPADCPLKELGVDDRGVAYTDYACQVDYEISSFGLDAFGSWNAWPEDLPTSPGKYPIEAWTDESLNYDRVLEYESGLRVVYQTVDLKTKE